MPGEAKSRYIHGLDGLRAFAVLFVMAYHFGFSWAQGGFLGVDVFFVLSGYLITSILLPAQGNEWNLDIKKFWLGRFRRLLPAAYAAIIVTTIWVVLFHKDILGTVRGDAVASMLYASNWWFIFHDVSYFDSFGSPSPLKNLWSLAIEEQFYIIWPLVLLLGFRLLKSTKKLAWVALAGLACSALLMAVLYQPGADPSRVYYGTDTRAFELLTGCLLAFIWPMKRLSKKNLKKAPRLALNAAGFAAFAVLLVCMRFVNEYEPFIYRGGMVLISLNAAILVAAISHPGSRLGQLLAWKPLRWIGTRSYGIYLWHYPVTILTTPVQEIGNPVWSHVLLQTAAVFVIAELSYRYIEMPIRRHGFRNFFRTYFSLRTVRGKGLPAGIAVAGLMIFAAGITGLAQTGSEKEADRPASVPGTLSEDGQKENASEQGTSHDRDNEPERKENDQNSSPNGNQSESRDELLNGEKDRPGNGQAGSENDDHTESESGRSDAAKDMNYTEVLAIGDSVLLDISSSLRRKVPNVTIDGKVGRQLSHAVQLAPSYQQFNKEGKAVIIELGTNGYFTKDQIEQLLDSFSKADIFIVNARVPRPWEGLVNRSLSKKAEEYDNVTLIDWHSAAITHPDYFAPDGVHLLPRGIEALSSLIGEEMGCQAL